MVTGSATRAQSNAARLASFSYYVARMRTAVASPAPPTSLRIRTTQQMGTLLGRGDGHGGDLAVTPVIGSATKAMKRRSET